MWIDGWWKAGNELVHDDHAEEWYGLLSADEEDRGIPRPVYYALAEYNRQLLEDGDVPPHEEAEDLYRVQWVCAPPERILPGAAVPVKVRVTDEAGRPAPGREVDVTRFVHTKWNEWHQRITTDAQGLAAADIPNPDEEGIMSVAVAVRRQDGTPSRACLYQTVLMEKGPGEG